MQDIEKASVCQEVAIPTFKPMQFLSLNILTELKGIRKWKSSTST